MRTAMLLHPGRRVTVELGLDDIVACGDTYDRCTVRGWASIESPVVVARAVDSPSWTVE